MKDVRILVIEDDPFMRRACEMGLKKKGFKVLTAVDGEDGLQQARAGAPHLILLDLLMPKLSGIETLEALKKDDRTRDIPVVILSNSSVERDVQRAQSMGAVDYLVKASLSLQELADRVAGYLEKTGHTESIGKES